MNEESNSRSIMSWLSVGLILPGALGRATLALLTYIYHISSLFYGILYWIFVGRWTRKKKLGRPYIALNMAEVGFHSLPIIFLILYLIGIILAINSVSQLEKFGQELLLAMGIAVAMTREMAPLLVGIVIAARIGAAMTAELGTMKVSEEIMALQTMAIEPVRFLVVPRFTALLIMLPFLTIMADIIGIMGGATVGCGLLGKITWNEYYHLTIDGLLLMDILTGLIKSAVFGAIIALVACHEGLSVEGGAEGVGRATTRSVVYSIVLIILADGLFTSLFYFWGLYS
jgi:phospholipid/cholesterol/gamma-HCH transport system permease protein